MNEHATYCAVSRIKPQYIRCGSRRPSRGDIVYSAGVVTHTGVANEPAMDVADRLIVPLDVPEIDRARALVDKLEGVVSIFKLGAWLQLVPGFERLIDDLIEAEKKVFIDTKGSDIPETMKAGVAGAARRGISFLTVHGNGEVTPDAMKAAVEASGPNLKIFSVTVLTSLDEDDLEQMGQTVTVQDLALRRASIALKCGCDGVITSGREARAIRLMAGSRPFLIVTAGIRPAGTDHNDHKRAVTPTEAIAAGADYLVVGRPIIRSGDATKAARDILDEMQTAFQKRLALSG